MSGQFYVFTIMVFTPVCVPNFSDVMMKSGLSVFEAFKSKKVNQKIVVLFLSALSKRLIDANNFCLIPPVFCVFCPYLRVVKDRLSS